MELTGMRNGMKNGRWEFDNSRDIKYYGEKIWTKEKKRIYQYKTLKLFQ